MLFSMCIIFYNVLFFHLSIFNIFLLWLLLFYSDIYQNVFCNSVLGNVTEKKGGGIIVK